MRAVRDGDRTSRVRRQVNGKSGGLDHDYRASAPDHSVAFAPAGLERAVKKCLAKDPDERWQNAGDLASELRWILESGSQSGIAAPVAARSRGRLLSWGALLLAAAMGILAGFLSRHPAAQPVLRVALNLPPGSSLVQGNAAVLSPDGQLVIMTLVDADGKSRFWIRRLSSDSGQPIAETE